MQFKSLGHIVKVHNKLYDKGWKWAAKNFGTYASSGQMLTDEGAFAMDCFLAGYLAAKKKKRKK